MRGRVASDQLPMSSTIITTTALMPGNRLRRQLAESAAATSFRRRSPKQKPSGCVGSASCSGNPILDSVPSRMVRFLRWAKLHRRPTIFCKATSPRQSMTNCTHIHRACRVDRLLTVALFAAALLTQVQDSRAQAPPLPIYKMQPLDTLPVQPYGDRALVTQIAQAAPAAAPAAPANQVADGAAQPLNPPASASTPAVSQGSFAPNMIGDGFGPPFLTNMNLFASPGGGVGTSKIAENASPLPRDRVYMNYSYFDGVPLLPGGVNVNRFTPGIEKTFFNGMSSIEVRMPFASTLSNTLFVASPNDTSSTELGNLTIYLKQLLYTSNTLAVSGGLGLTLPTASNATVFDTLGGLPLTYTQNQSVHLLPFLGSLYTPTDQLFVQQFLQFDFDANGNAVSLADNNNILQPAGRLNEMSFLYYSVGAGYWLYNDPNSDRLFTRIAPIVELHYNKSLTQTDALLSPSNLDLLNGVVGMTATMGQNKTLTLAYTSPLSNFHDRQFNGELRVMFNWFYGGSMNRFSRVQF